MLLRGILLVGGGGKVSVRVGSWRGSCGRWGNGGFLGEGWGGKGRVPMG